MYIVYYSIPLHVFLNLGSPFDYSECNFVKNLSIICVECP